MSASLKLDIKKLKQMAAAMSDPRIKEALRTFPMKKSVVAIVAQAISDNFAQEGPGWAPLKAATIRASVAKGMRKKLGKMTDDELLEYEAKARKKGATSEPNRLILRKSRLLYKTVTTPGFHGSNKEGKSGSNIWKQEGTNLVYGTDLAYASVHQKGDPKKHIPARPYLTLRKEWRDRLMDHLARSILKTIRDSISGVLA